MCQVILASNSAHYPIDKQGSVNVVQVDGSQHTNPKRIQLGEAYRPHAGHHVSLYDAHGIRTIV